MLGAVSPELMEKVKGVAQQNSVAPMPPELEQALSGQAPAAPAGAPAPEAAPPGPAGVLLQTPKPHLHP